MNITMLDVRPTMLLIISQNEEASFHLEYWINNRDYWRLWWMQRNTSIFRKGDNWYPGTTWTDHYFYYFCPLDIKLKLRRVVQIHNTWQYPGPSQSTGKLYLWVLVTQLCPTVCDPMDCFPPGSFIHGILQARILEWAAIPFSEGSSWPRDWTRVSCLAGKFFTIWAITEACWYLLRLYSPSTNRYIAKVEPRCGRNFSPGGCFSDSELAKNNRGKVKQSYPIKR